MEFVASFLEIIELIFGYWDLEVYKSMLEAYISLCP